MAILDQLKNSTLNLDGALGLSDRKFAFSAIDNSLSRLHNTYSIYGDDSKIIDGVLVPGVKVLDFNKTTSKFDVPAESTLDELDLKAPKNREASVVYKSSKGNNYKDLGPLDGRY